jgi:hypothetical protein
MLIQTNLSTIIYLGLLIFAIITIIWISVNVVKGKYKKTLDCGYSYKSLGTVSSIPVTNATFNSPNLFRTNDTMSISTQLILNVIVMKLQITSDPSKTATEQPYYFLNNANYGLTIFAFYKSTATGNDINGPINVFSGVNYLTNYTDNTITLSNDSQKKMSDILIKNIPGEDYKLSFLVNVYSLNAKDYTQPLFVNIDVYYLFDN